MGRAEVGIREEMPLPLDKAAGPPFLPSGLCFGGFVLSPSPLLFYKAILQQFILANSALLFTLRSLILLESPFYEILSRDPVVIFLCKVSPFPQPY